MKDVTTIILAAGKGTRMKSDIAKVLHPILGIPMLYYPIDISLNKICAYRTIVVVGHQADRIKEIFKDSRITFVVQEEQLGTGHAVKIAIPYLSDFSGTILILSGDVPLIREETILSFIDTFEENESFVSVLTAIVKDPSGYGRIIRNSQGWLERIVEDKDAEGDDKLIGEINTGIYCVRSSFLKEKIDEIRNDNAQKEYYLTDLIKIARRMGLRCSAHIIENSLEAIGINTRIDLAMANEFLRNQKARELMLSGVTLLDPKTTYIEKMVEIGRDTVIYPNCMIQGKTRIGERCLIESNVKIVESTIGNDVTIRSCSVITESMIEDVVSIGPFAHLRPKTEIRSKAKIGNFVEVKKSIIGRGSKANHLTYIGDSVVGEDVNIGAGTITCNYDGFEKHQTIIGDRVFVGSNVELIAPVKVGNNALIGAGTTVTRDVPEGALAISRVKQKNIKGWNKRLEIRRKKMKKEE